MPDLRHIRTFTQLVRYLEDELGWPLDGYGVDDLTFVYEADELGLKPVDAAKVKKIRQLRPLDSNQPWGIFFIEFDRKKLPVVVLRRILSHLVVKKRASANKADRAAWSAEDLLFISAFGAEDEDGREITFAHFHQEDGDLPTLRVLGWDGSDTPLKFEHLEKTLKERLHWPDAKESLDAWRARWAGVFRHRVGHIINTSDMLAEAMAELAKRIRDAAKTLIDRETEKGPLRKLHEAFKTHLIHDLTEEGFADTYAQTITYGLLTAAISRTEMSAGKHGTALVASNVTDMVPVTNPFLKEMLQTFLQVGGRKGGIDFDELGVQDVVELLRGNETDLPAILRDFNNKTRGEDPVLHFYEHFLSAYNKQLKIQRGVFYTPQPVVSYIVRSVHELLQTEFGLEHGLADTTTWSEMIQKGNAGVPPASSSQSGQDARAPLKLPPLTDEPGCAETISSDEMFVQILDPATGTATFLVEVIDVIHNHLQSLWKKRGAAAMPSIPNSKSNIQNWSDFWNTYVPKALLPRLHAYELMMAPYAIAHMKIGLKLAETGYRFETEERARIYLTNALEKSDDKQAKLIGFDALAHEAEAVNKIKKTKRFTVIIGNPPYANYSSNLSPEARRIVDKYRNFRGIQIRERNQLQFERNIQDDFVKFISIAQDLVGSSGVGVFAYITNGTMLASTSLRGLRENLAGNFSSLFELNLHGGGNEIIAGAEDDENVFDIVQSVAIHIYVRSKPGGASELSYADLLGGRALKYAALATRSVKDTVWRLIQPDAENCSFTPQDDAGGGASRRLDSAFVKFGAGIKTNRDAVVIGFDDASLIETVREFNATLASGRHAQSNIHPLLYRPFDVRKIFYHEDVVASRSLPTMKHVVAGPNIGFVCSSTWTTPERFSVGVSQIMVEMKTGTHDRGTTFFPLYRYETLMGGKPDKVHNFTPEFVKEWCAKTQTQFIPTGHGDGEKTTGPEDVLFWLYGLFSSLEYRRRYRAALSQRFPIVLFAKNLELFQELSRLGGELTALHLLESPKLDKPMTKFVGSSREVVKVGWVNDTVWINAGGKKAATTPGTSGFQGVPEAVWNFHIGGYQVCEKWLKDRKGRTLTDEDIAHYHKIVISLSETIRLMAEIDQVIESHGGWPGAFAGDAK
jgi:type I restriction-modification system DNA methylase subunit